VNESHVRHLVQQVLDEVAPGVDVGGVPADADLRIALDLDSLDFLNYVVGLDELTGLQTTEQDYPRLTTIAGCQDYLTHHGVAV
jgi:acyl carrier protein